MAGGTAARTTSSRNVAYLIRARTSSPPRNGRALLLHVRAGGRRGLRGWLLLSGVRFLPGAHLDRRGVEQALIVLEPHHPAGFRRELRPQRVIGMVDLQGRFDA